MRLIQQQLLLETIKEKFTVLNFVKTSFKLSSWARTIIWLSTISISILLLLLTMHLVPRELIWVAPLFVIFFVYGLFRQSELYRRPYYRKLNLQSKPWAVRRRLADLERIRGVLKSAGFYRREEVEAYIRQIDIALDLKHSASIWQHPLFLFALGFLTSLLTQSFVEMVDISNPMIFAFFLFVLFLTITVIPQIYDIFTGERQLLKRLLISFVVISSDFGE